MTYDQAILGSGLPRLDAEVLLGFAAGCSRTALMTRGGDDLPEDVLQTFDALVVRRKRGEPVSHLTGTKEFYGRPFAVTKDTLIPRPSTEGLVDLTLSFLKRPEKTVVELDTGIVGLALPLRDLTPTTIVDIGTGSGCLAITLVKEGVAQKMIGVDVSAAALTIAKKNAETLGAKHIEWKEADGADAILGIGEPFLVVSNPPYIPDGTPLQKDVADYEPAAALFSGPDGLGLIRRLVASASGNIHCVGIIFECRADQVEAIEDML